MGMLKAVSLTVNSGTAERLSSAAAIPSDFAELCIVSEIQRR